MATIAATNSFRTTAPGAYDRVFYSGMAIAMALTVVTGFARTYYLRSYFGPSVSVTGGTALSPLVHLHGALFTAWMVLFIVQTALVATRRVAIHRRLGLAAVALAVAMVVVGTKTAIIAAARGSAPPGLEPLVFLVVPIFDMILFSGFVATAVWRRRDKEAHKRLMLLAYASIIVAGVARIPGVIALGPLGFFALSFLFVAVRDDLRPVVARPDSLGLQVGTRAACPLGAGPPRAIEHRRVAIVCGVSDRFLGSSAFALRATARPARTLGVSPPHPQRSARTLGVSPRTLCEVPALSASVPAPSAKSPHPPANEVSYSPLS